MFALLRQLWRSADVAALGFLPSACAKEAKVAMVATALPLSQTGQRIIMDLRATELILAGSNPMAHKCNRATIHIGKEDDERDDEW